MQSPARHTHTHIGSTRLLSSIVVPSASSHLPTTNNLREVFVHTAIPAFPMPRRKRLQTPSIPFQLQQDNNGGLLGGRCRSHPATSRPVAYRATISSTRRGGAQQGAEVAARRATLAPVSSQLAELASFITHRNTKCMCVVSETCSAVPGDEPQRAARGVAWSGALPRRPRPSQAPLYSQHSTPQPPFMAVLKHLT